MFIKQILCLGLSLSVAACRSIPDVSAARRTLPLSDQSSLQPRLKCPGSGPNELDVNCDGNLVFAFTNRTINLQNIPIDDVLKAIEERCDENLCDPAEYKITGPQFGRLKKDYSIVLTVDGAYTPSLYERLRDTMREVTRNNVGRKETVNWQQRCEGRGEFSLLCPSQPGGQIGSYEATITPGTWRISYQPPGSEELSPPFMQVSMVEAPEDKEGACKDLFDAAGSIAGAAHGATAVPFELMKLVCSALD